VVDDIIWEAAPEADGKSETFQNFPRLRARIKAFIASSLAKLLPLSAEEIVAQRYSKFRALGTFVLMNEEQRAAAIAEAEKKRGPVKKSGGGPAGKPSALLVHLAEEIVSGTLSRYRELAPPVPFQPPAVPVLSSDRAQSKATPVEWENAKSVLDRDGPEGLVRWVKKQTKVGTDLQSSYIFPSPKLTLSR